MKTKSKSYANKTMQKKYFYLITILLCFAATTVAQNISTVFNLTCDHEDSPIGIDNETPRFSWQINSQSRNFEQSAFQLLVADSKEALEAGTGNIWDSGKVNESSSILVPFAGKKLESGKNYYWKVKIWDRSGNASTWSKASRFGMGLLTEKDWGAAQWIALEKDRKDAYFPVGIHAPNVVKDYDEKKAGKYMMPQFRKEFATKKSIKSATVFISGLGHFDMFINGNKVGDNFLDPGWTKYDKCALYVSFDITDQLVQGDNTIGVMLGNGFYNIPHERYIKMLTSYGAPKMKMFMKIKYSDGSTQDIVSDSGWKVTESPVTFSSIYGGEDYDATKEHDGWMLAGFNDKSWSKPVVADYKTALLSQRAAPLKVRDRLPTVRLLQTARGEWVYDLGQNFSGIIELKVKGKNGNENLAAGAGGKAERQSVKFIPAELLNPDSSVNQSASGYPFYFKYTPKGSDVEQWRPQFTYYGFRYVQIEGAVPVGKPNPDNLPEIIDIVGLHTCNSAEEVGSFNCSNDMFNRIYSLIDWSMRSNMASVITDCPHREKLGWLEVAHLMQYSFQYRYDVARLYEKKMMDMRSTQAANGFIPTIAPELVEFEGGFRDTPEWGSAFIISPWYVYLWYGDRSLIEKYYPDMRRYLDYLTSKAKNHIISYGLGDWYDIGPKNPGYAQLTSNGVTATAIYYYNTTIMQKIALLLGENDDAEKYGKLLVEIKKAFNDKFWNKSTLKYDRDSQTANAIALYTGLTDDTNREQAFENLKADIRGRNNALTAGDVGYRYVLRALESNDASDIIYDMNCKYDVPGYGWQLAHGATSLTESWQAYGFVSNNHCMLGHLMEWLFGGLGGIRQDQNSTAYKNIVFKPEVVGDIREVNVSHKSPYGVVRSEWKDGEDAFTLRVEVPANSFASVYLPASEVTKITESGVSLREAAGITDTFLEKDRVVVKIGSGIYNFKVLK